MIVRQFQNQGSLCVERCFNPVQASPPDCSTIFYNKAFEAMSSKNKRHLAANRKTLVDVLYCTGVHKSILLYLFTMVKHQLENSGVFA